MLAVRWFRRDPAIFLAVVIVAGCSGAPWRLPSMKGEIPAPKTPAKAGQTQVRAGGDGFALGDVEQPACSPQQFVDRTGELLRAGQTGAANRWIQRYPDIALAILRDPGSVQAAPDLLLKIAQSYDQQCSRAAPNAGWAALVADRTARHDHYAAYDQKRRQFMTNLQNSATKEALELGLTEIPQGVPGTMLSIDALRLTGIAMVLGNRPEEGAAALEKAVSVAAQDHPYQAVSLLLLVSDAQRRAGHSAVAEQSWQRAALLAAELASGPRPVVDPILWERVAYLRPVDCRWPGDVQRRLWEVNTAFALVPPPRDAAVPVSTAPAAIEEAPLWISIGHWRLARDEPQAALVALKRAESSTTDNYTGDRLRLAQAKTLARMGQSGPASAILIRLAGSSDPRVLHPALAMLGALKLQQGGIQQGFNLLRRSVEGDPLLQWPERPEAEADLGLAYLLVGDENAGLRWLHDAQQAMESAGQQESLIQCLENEAAYLEKGKKNDLAKAVRRRLESLQSI